MNKKEIIIRLECINIFCKKDIELYYDGEMLIKGVRCVSCGNVYDVVYDRYIDFIYLEENFDKYNLKYDNNEECFAKYEKRDGDFVEYHNYAFNNIVVSPLNSRQ